MIIQTCTCNTLRRQALQKSEMTLAELLSAGPWHLQESRHPVFNYNENVQHKDNQGKMVWPSRWRGVVKKRCYNCSGPIPHHQGMPCPVQGKICNARGKHFAKCCRSRRPQSSIRDEHKVHYVHTNGNTRTASQVASSADTVF